jgi:transcriptional regulator with XRE-family HTH domain
MSSTYLHEFGSTLHMQRATHFVVRIGREAVADFISQKVAELGWSYGEIVRRSGGHIKSASTLVNIVNGNVQRVSEETLLGLAHAFKITDDFILNLYRGKSPIPMPPTDFSSALQAMGVAGFEAYGGIESLTDDDRQEIIAMIGTMIEQKLIRRQKTAVAVKGKPQMATVASPLHPPGWETQPGPGREGEKPIFSASKKGKKSQPEKKSRQA